MEMTTKQLILKEIMEVYGFEKKIDFAKKLGIPTSTLGSWFSRSTFDYDLLYNKLEKLNPDFLFTGIGSVLIDSNTVKVPDNSIELENFQLKSDSVLQDQSVPLFDLEAVAGIVPLHFDMNDQTPIDHIVVPNLPKCDGAVYVVGDSMYPLLKSGDIVMFKRIEDIQNDIYWGEMYLVSVRVGSEDFIMVKFIQKSEKGDDFVKLVSQNKHHQDKDVKISKIKGLALIKASIRINSMN